MQQPVPIEHALGRKYPEPVALVTTRGADGQPNVMAVGWIMLVSDEPWMFALGIDAEAYTLALIRETREFVVAFPDEGMGPAVLHAGRCHGRGRDKLAEAGLATQPAARVRAPLLAEAVANFECELETICQPGNCPLVVGRVVAAHAHTDPRRVRVCVVGPGHALAGVRPVTGPALAGSA